MQEILRTLGRLWRKVPYRHVFAFTAFLAFAGEQYPFSDFPMYSHLDNEADVLYVTDQTDRVLPMEKLFGTSSSTQKKVFITELKDICNPAGRDTRDALPEERQKAGGKLVEKLFPRFKPHNLPEVGGNVTGLRFYYKVFTVNDGTITTSQPQLVAEKAL